MMEIDKIKFTSSAGRALDKLKSYVEGKQHNIATASHVFYLCFANANISFSTFLFERKCLVSLDDLESYLDKYAEQNPDKFKSDVVEYRLCDSVNVLIRESFKLANEYGHAYVGVEHLVASFLSAKENALFVDFLEGEGVDTMHLALSTDVFIAGDDDESYDYGGDYDEDEDDDDDDVRLSSNMTSRFCLLLNNVVSQPTFPKITGRDKEIKLMEEILCRKNKRNCVLVGEAGTGKTTIVEGLAQMVSDEAYEGPLKGKKIYSLDLGLLVAGTKFRGQFEERFSKLLKEIQASPDNIMFIDEIHTIVGTGSKEGAQDVANMLKPALARGDFQCVGATTSTEYKKYIEKDAALARRFHPVNVEEPELEYVIDMAIAAMPAYEEHHGIKIPKNVIILAAEMCQTYLPNQRFPDKLFDILDQSSAKTKIKAGENPSVSADDICEVIAAKIDVDVETIKESQGKTFTSFPENVNEAVFGQEENISNIYDLLACGKAGFQSKDKPIASFFFVGPTSVGKTYTAKQIAKEFYGNEKSFLQLNMSEYQDQGSISRLIGTSAGYVGYEDGGLLTEFVRKNPNSLILFDEAEKCNRNILNLLLQILDEAKLTDNLGRNVDFSRCIVVMTSNIGTEEQAKPQMGFIQDEVSAKDSYKKSVTKFLPPELVSRIDEVVVFNALEKESVTKIFNSRVSDMAKMLEKKGIKLKLEASASDFIDFNSKDHARDVKKIVRQKIEIPLAKHLVQNPKKKKICVKMLDGILNIG